MAPAEADIRIWIHAVSSCGTHSSSVPVTGSTPLLIGRSNTAHLQIPWDPLVSRRHAAATPNDVSVLIQRLPEGRNPLHLGNLSVNRLELKVGDSGFRIGQTHIFLSDTPELSRRRRAGLLHQLDAAEDHPGSVHESSFRLVDLNAQVSPDRVALLEKLPDLVARCTTDADLAGGIAELLLESIPAASAVAALLTVHDSIGSNPGSLKFHSSSRVACTSGLDTRLQPSRRLIHQAITSDNAVVHHWNGETSSIATLSGRLNWTFCVPLIAPGVTWVLYVAGEEQTGGLNQSTLKADLRFTQVLGKFLSSIQNIRRLQEQTTRLSSFFSPNVIRGITGTQSVELQEHVVTEVAVLFCDMRGFSRRSEQMGNDLTTLLECAREALSLMTGSILDHDGSIADFQGDAVLGFWGWPLRLSEGALPAVRAALQIVSEIRNAIRRNPLLQDVSAGIGIATGTAVAGHIGTEQVSKIGVFGPVVNQCSRLEGLTRFFGVKIIVDDATAGMMQQMFSEENATLRRLGMVQPAGMTSVMNIWEVIPEEEMSHQKQIELNTYSAALALFMEGKWALADRMLTTIPNDGPGVYLRHFMQMHHLIPPEQWRGVIQLNAK